VSEAGGAARSGVLLGVIIVFMLQQFGYLSLSTLWPEVVLYLAVGAIAGGFVFGLIGRWLAK
jgi:uncharacterized protein (DUF2062 family)